MKKKEKKKKSITNVGKR